MSSIERWDADAEIEIVKDEHRVPTGLRLKVLETKKVPLDTPKWWGCSPIGAGKAAYEMASRENTVMRFVCLRITSYRAPECKTQKGISVGMLNHAIPVASGTNECNSHRGLSFLFLGEGYTGSARIYLCRRYYPEGTSRSSTHEVSVTVLLSSSNEKVTLSMLSHTVRRQAHAIEIQLSK